MHNKLRIKLLELIEIVYMNIDEDIKKSYSNFKITLSKKMQKKNQSYSNREFVICNLYRQEAELVNSLIICLAHHIDYCNTGETKRSSPEFVQVYQDLLYAALSNHFLDYIELRNSNDYKEQKKIREVLSTFWDDSKINEEHLILEVYNCYQIKEILKSQNYKYNSSYGSWEIEVESSQLFDLQNSLKKLDERIILNTRSTHKIIFVIDCLIEVIGKSYKYRKKLKENKYFFKDGKWVKKIKSYEFLEEKKKVEEIVPQGLGIKIDINFQ